MTDRVRWVAVGRVTRAHGVRGEVAVLSLSEVPERFRPGSRVFLDESEDHSLTVASARPHRDRLLVRFQEVRDRDRAEALRGRYLFVPTGWAPPPPPGAYWAHDLVGCEVVASGGRSLGRIREVIRAPANDVWVADGGEGEVLIPALRDVVTRVDLSARRVEVRELPGLTAP